MCNYDYLLHHIPWNVLFSLLPSLASKLAKHQHEYSWCKSCLRSKFTPFVAFNTEVK